MKRHFLICLIIVFLMIFSNCHSKLDKYDRIEMIVFKTRYGFEKTDPNILFCGVYLIIDNKGVCKLINGNRENWQYKKLDLPKSIIQQLVDTMSFLNRDLDLRPCIWDAIKVKIVLSFSGQKKSVLFYDYLDKTGSVYVSFYKLINQLNSTEKYNSFSDTSEIKALRNKFLEDNYESLFKNDGFNNGKHPRVIY